MARVRHGLCPVLRFPITPYGGLRRRKLIALTNKLHLGTISTRENSDVNRVSYPLGQKGLSYVVFEIPKLIIRENEILIWGFDS